MKERFDDIRERVETEPDWWDVRGCPRYGTPPHDERFMRWIACQACGEVFRVCLFAPNRLPYPHDKRSQQVLVEEDDGHQGKLRKDWAYQDPPRHDCPTGDTMTSIPEYRFLDAEYSHYDLPDPESLSPSYDRSSDKET